MGIRSQNLRTRLIEVSGINTVYIQPPPDNKLVYPCIMISRTAVSVKRADNKAYTIHYRYTVTRISKKDDDGEFVTKCLENFEHCYHDRSFVTDGLYHDVLYIYYKQ